jgi:hypothetical protein
MPNPQCSTVHELGPGTPWVECLVTGDRTYRVRISHVRTIAPTIDDDDAPDVGVAPSAAARIWRQVRHR